MQDVLDHIARLAQGLACAHFSSPPVEPLLLALQYGIPVVPSDGATLWHTNAGRPCLHYDRTEFEPRARFAVAHELLEVLADQGRIDFTVPPELVSHTERIFQHGAAELLMPAPMLADEGAACGWDLAHLQTTFRVSLEALGRKVLQHIEAVLTIVDNGEVVCRAATPGLRAPAQLDPIERHSVEQVHQAWPSLAVHQARGPRFSVQSWAALPERQQIRRVVMLTLPLEWD